jgi:hypothetical protein
MDSIYVRQNGSDSDCRAAVQDVLSEFLPFFVISMIFLSPHDQEVSGAATGEEAAKVLLRLLLPRGLGGTHAKVLDVGWYTVQHMPSHLVLDVMGN